MIIGLIVTTVSIFISLVALILPAWRIPDDIIGVLAYGVDMGNIINGFFALKALIIVFGTIMIFEGALIATRLVFGLISVIRGGGKIDI